MKLVSPELQAGGRRARYTTLFGPWVLLFILVAGISALFALVTELGDGVASGKTNDIFYCDSSGRIRYQYSDDNDVGISPYWDTRLFLSVTMGPHGLNFNQAKAIDIFFDLVVGRGSQILVALATYPILRRSILRSMEVREFSLALLLPFFLERISVYSLWALCARMRLRRTKPKTDDQTEQIKFRKARVRIDWRVVLVFLVGCYVLALPTFASVMTSYQVRSKPFKTEGLGYVSMEEFHVPTFTLLYYTELYNGLPLSENYPFFDGSDLLSTCQGYNDANDEAYDFMNDIFIAYENALKVVERDDVAGKREAFRRVRESLPSEWNLTDHKDPPQWSYNMRPRDLASLASPDSDSILNYNDSARESMIVIGNITYNMNATRLQMRPNGPEYDYGETMRLAYNNESFTAAEILEQGKCLPGDNDDYIWGFSSLLLFSFCMLTIIVALILITLHYDAYFNSAADRYELSISPYRDLLDLADELRAHYGAAAAADMPAKELDRAMREDPVATGLETATLHRSRRARWKQGKASKNYFSRGDARKRSKAAEGQGASDAEESLMSMGFDARLHSEIEMAKLPAKVASRSTDGM